MPWTMQEVEKLADQGAPSIHSSVGMPVMDSITQLGGPQLFGSSLGSEHVPVGMQAIPPSMGQVG